MTKKENKSGCKGFIDWLLKNKKVFAVIESQVVVTVFFLSCFFVLISSILLSLLYLFLTSISIIREEKKDGEDDKGIGSQSLSPSNCKRKQK